MSRDALWSCTTCFACQDICPGGIEHVGKIVDMRRNLVLMEGEFPGEEVMTAMEATEVNGNPLGIGYASRGDWAEELVSTGKLKINASDLTCTYHDSCYLGRHNDIYAASRGLIKTAGGTLVEMEKNGDQSFCCSAGGGRILAEEKLGSRINMYQTGSGYGIKIQGRQRRRLVR